MTDVIQAIICAVAGFAAGVIATAPRRRRWQVAVCSGDGNIVSQGCIVTSDGGHIDGRCQYCGGQK